MFSLERLTLGPNKTVRNNKGAFPRSTSNIKTIYMDASSRIIYKSPSGKLYTIRNGKKRYNPIKRYEWYRLPGGSIVKYDLLETLQKKYGPFYKKHPRTKMSVFTSALKRVAPTCRVKNNIKSLKEIIRKYKKGLIVGKGGKTMYTPMPLRKKRRSSVKGPMIYPPNVKPKLESNNVNVLAKMMTTAKI